MTDLYRHYDANGRLLYVGISFDALVRLKAHIGVSCWAHDIVRVDLQKIGSRRAALEAELLAIRTENPAHNIAGIERDLPSMAAAGLRGTETENCR